MTIKICHDKFDNRAGIAYRIFKIIFKIGLFVVLVGSIIMMINDNSYMKMFWAMPIMMPVMALFFIYFMIPWIDDTPTGLDRINKKLKLFEWNEDC